MIVVEHTLRDDSVACGQYRGAGTVILYKRNLLDLRKVYYGSLLAEAEYGHLQYLSSFWGSFQDRRRASRKLVEGFRQILMPFLQKPT